MKKGLLTLLMTLCLGVFMGFGQAMDPTNWTSSQKKTGDNEYELVFKATLEPGWKIFSVNTPKGGSNPTVLVIEQAGKGVELIGSPVENEPTKKYSDVFKVEEWYFTDTYTLTQKIKVTDPALANVNATVEFQVCEESCINLERSFDFKLEGRPTAELKAADSAPATTEEAKDDNLWVFFWLAFGSGLLAVVMPCVFPMIPMTVSFFMHGDSSKAKARSKALFFSFSIIAIYTVLGLIISFLLGPGFINWLSTHWLPNSLFFIIFILFAASFFGAFEIVLPSKLVNKTDQQADKGGYIGAFFMAFTLVLVSFSCTAPIVGTVLVEAATGSVLRPVIGMLGFSVAMALPFGFFAFFPSKLNSLKSGGWMNTVKVCLGFVEVALGFKFLSVADQTYHWGLLDREIYIAIWIAVFTLMGLYLLGKIKFKHDSELPYIGVGRLTFIIITFSFVVYLIPGMFGAPLNFLAGYLPPQKSIDFDLNRIVRDNAQRVIDSGVQFEGETTQTTTKSTDQKEVVKYSDFLSLPHGLKGYFDYEQALKVAQELDKPLFIDFTGHGCTNCREMENRVWNDDRVLNILRKEYVIVALYVDDKTKLPEEEHYISDYDGKKKNTLGKKNTDLQVKKFESNAQPNYILLDSRHGHEEDLKDHILAPKRGHSLDKDAFYNFLKQGVDEYKKRAK